MRKLLLILVSLTLLTGAGCFGGNASQDEIPPNYKVFSNDSFDFQHFIDWEVLGVNDLKPDFPQGTILAVRNNIKERDKFITNFTVTKNIVPEGTDAVGYGLQVKNQHKGNVVNFNLENEERITTMLAGAEVPTLYIVFTGKLRPQGDTLRYFQKFVTKGQEGYILTIAAPLNEETLTLDKAKNIMKSFNLK